MWDSAAALSEMRKTLVYGDTRISYTIQFGQSLAKRIRISLLPNGHVEVLAPLDADLQAIENAVRQRARWIWQQLQAWRLRQEHVLPRRYVSGESHFYLGRRHMLKVVSDKASKPGVKMLRGRLEVHTPDTSPRTIQSLLNAWYRERAQEVFHRRLASCLDRAVWLKQAPSIRLLNMKTQWGSCSPKGELILNPSLVKAPSACIDYVLCHELCHIQQHNHSKRFYTLLTQLVPEWVSHKQELDDMAEMILR